MSCRRCHNNQPETPFLVSEKNELTCLLGCVIACDECKIINFVDQSDDPIWMECYRCTGITYIGLSPYSQRPLYHERDSVYGQSAPKMVTPMCRDCCQLSKYLRSVPACSDCYDSLNHRSPIICHTKLIHPHGCLEVCANPACEEKNLVRGHIEGFRDGFICWACDEITLDHPYYIGDSPMQKCQQMGCKCGMSTEVPYYVYGSQVAEYQKSDVDLNLTSMNID